MAAAGSVVPVLPRAPLGVLRQECCPAQENFPSSRSGPALLGDDGGSSAGPQLLVQSPECCSEHPEVPADPKRLNRHHKENLPGRLEVSSPASSHCQHLDSALSRDLLLPPSSQLSDPSRTNEAASGLLPGKEASPAPPSKVVTTPRI